MAASRTPAKADSDWRVMMKRSLMRAGKLVGAGMLALFMLFAAIALLDYHESDPSLNTAAGGPVDNVAGLFGAGTAGLLLWLLGLGAAMLLPLGLTFARRLWIDDDMHGWKGQIGRCLGGVVLIDTGLELLSNATPVGLPAGRGGLLAQLFARQARNLTALIPGGWGYWTEWLLLAVLIVAGLA